MIVLVDFHRMLGSQIGYVFLVEILALLDRLAFFLELRHGNARTKEAFGFGDDLFQHLFISDRRSYTPGKISGRGHALHALQRWPPARLLKGLRPSRLHPSEW
jgi:hypothetical protein